MISDVEIVAIPRTYQRQTDLFGAKAETISELDELLGGMQLTFSKSGQRYKQFVYRDYQVDLFLANTDNVGLILLIRTGPADFSRAMVTPQPYGFKPSHLTVSDGYVWANHLVGGPQARTREAVPDEETLFRLWGMDWIPPQERK
jgi:DNA polymerase/3'-5' exonuclease PolX